MKKIVVLLIGVVIATMAIMPVVATNVSNDDVKTYVLPDKIKDRFSLCGKTLELIGMPNPFSKNTHVILTNSETCTDIVGNLVVCKI